MSADQLIFGTAGELKAGDRILTLSSFTVLLKVSSVRARTADETVIVTLEGGNVLDLPAGTNVDYRRPLEPATVDTVSGYGSEDECLSCGEHISDPHAVDCERAS